MAALLAASDGADVDLATNGGRTALYIACKKGHTEIAMKLIAANAEVNHARGNGITPLIIACEFGRTEVVTILIAANADVNKANDVGAVRRRSPWPPRARHSGLC